MKYDPYKILKISDAGQWPDNFDPYEEAVKHFTPEGLISLVQLLKSEDEYISGHGLFLFGLLGKKVHAIVDDALLLVKHPNVMARNSLLDGVLCYTKKLSPSQVQKILPLADDPNFSEGPAELVRGKVITIIGALRVDVIADAINILSDRNMRLAHLEAFRVSLAKITNAQQAFNKARKYSSLNLVYSLAAIERAAREGKIDTTPTYIGDDHVSELVVMNIKRILNQHLRRKDPDAWRRLMQERRKPNLTD